REDGLGARVDPCPLRPARLVSPDEELRRAAAVAARADDRGELARRDVERPPIALGGLELEEAFERRLVRGQESSAHRGRLRRKCRVAVAPRRSPARLSRRNTAARVPTPSAGSSDDTCCSST